MAFFTLLLIATALEEVVVLLKPFLIKNFQISLSPAQDALILRIFGP